MMAYAENTTVPIEKSMGEIKAMIRKAGADKIAQYEEADKIAVQFYMRERMIRFRVSLPGIADVAKVDGRGYGLSNDQRIRKRDQAQRQRVRALLLVIKAKLESIESNVETFEEAFLANVVMADGRTIYERIAEPIALEYQTGQAVPMLLEGPRQ